MIDFYAEKFQVFDNTDELSDPSPSKRYATKKVCPQFRGSDITPRVHDEVVEPVARTEQIPSQELIGEIEQVLTSEITTGDNGDPDPGFVIKYSHDETEAYNGDGVNDGVNDNVINEETEAIQKIAEEYSVWMKSLFEGKFKDDKNAATESACLLRHLRGMGLSETIKPLFDEKYFQTNFLKYRNVEVKGKVKSNATMGTYVQCLMGFVNYIVDAKKFVNWGVPFKDIMAFIQMLKRLKATYQKLRSVDDRAREEEECVKLATYLKEDTIGEYVKSHGPAAGKLLDEFECHSKKKVTRTDYCIVRDYLMTLLEFRTAHRDGVIPHLTIDRFICGEWNKDGEFQVLVREHKTFSSSGSAHVNLTEDLYKKVKIFLEYIRCNIPSGNTNVYMFAPWTGVNALQSGSTSRVITKELQNAGLLPANIKMSSTDARKKLCTALRDIHPDCAAKIALSMKHKEETATKFYLRADEGKNSHLVQAMMGDYWKMDTKHKKDEDKLEEMDTKQKKDEVYHTWETEDEQKLEEHFRDKAKWSTRSMFDNEYELMKDTLKKPGTPEKAYQKLQRVFSPTKYIAPKCNIPSVLLPKRKKKQTGLTTAEAELLYGKCEKLLYLKRRTKEMVVDAIAGTVLEKYDFKKIQSVLQYWSLLLKQSNKTLDNTEEQ